MKRGRVDTKTICGGKALAQYLAQVVVAKQHHEKDQIEELKAKLERQKVLAKKLRLNTGQFLSYQCCNKCGALIGEDLATTIYCIEHGRFCMEKCSYQGESCPSCWHLCGYFSGCTNDVKTIDRVTAFECVKCHTILCNDHMEYCRWCGDAFCFASECAKKHEGECGRKKK